jgi:hypothetical protein
MSDFAMTVLAIGIVSLILGYVLGFSAGIGAFKETSDDPENV